ncbi:MAG TPA: hypothetical protein VEI02_05560, partial [Planctomycetota bacterium]|nr:hypothetical protein [Planctomycetota bacterium]
TLGYVRKGSEWARPATWKPPRPDSKGDAAACAERLRRATAPYLAAILEAAASDAGLGAADLEARWAALEEAVALAPDDEALRAARREVLDAGRWLLAETVAARPRRAAIAAAAAAATKAAPEPEAAPLDAVDAKVRIPWTGAVRTPVVAVAGTIAGDELSRCARAVHAAVDVFRAATQADARLEPGFTVLAPANAAHRDAVARTHPGVEDADRERHVKNAAFTFGARVVVFEGEERGRLDAACSYAAGSLASSALGVWGDRGAMYQGFTLHVTWLTLGTRLSFFTRPDAYGGTALLRDRLLKPDVDWFLEAKAALGEARPPRFENLLRVDVNGLEARDLVVGYAFFVYLLETRPPDAFARISRALGGDRLPEEVLVEHLRLTPNLLSSRLARWLDERRF